MIHTQRSKPDPYQQFSLPKAHKPNYYLVGKILHLQLGQQLFPVLLLVRYDQISFPSGFWKILYIVHIHTMFHPVPYCSPRCTLLQFSLDSSLQGGSSASRVPTAKLKTPFPLTVITENLRILTKFWIRSKIFVWLWQWIGLQLLLNTGISKLNMLTTKF